MISDVLTAMASSGNIGRRGWLKEGVAGCSKVNRDQPDVHTPKHAQVGCKTSPRGARTCEIWGSLRGGERRRDRKQRTQVEPHPGLSGRRKVKQNMNCSEAKPRGRSSAGCPPPLFLRPHLADKPDPTQNLGSFARSCQQPPAQQPRGD